MERRCRCALAVLILAAAGYLGGCADDSARRGSWTLTDAPLMADGQAELNELEGLTALLARQKHRSSLQIHGTPAQSLDLRPLSSLERVEGSLSLFWFRLKNVDTLGALRYVRDLHFDRLYGLETISGLAGVDSVGRFEIVDCDSLRSLAGAPRRVTERLALRDLPCVTSLAGFEDLSELEHLHIRHLPGLESLSGLPALPGLRFLVIERNDGLRDLDGLPSGSSVQDLYVKQCKGLQSMAGIEVLAKVRRIHGQKLPALEDLTALAGMDSVTGIDFEDCAALSDFSPLGEMPDLIFLRLDRCPGLASVSRFGARLTLESLTLTRNENLVDLGGLHLVRLKNLAIDHNPKLVHLADLRELPELESLRLGGSAAFSELPELPKLAELRLYEIGTADLRNFPALPRLQKLTIGACDSLRTLRGLSIPASLDRLAITECDSLRSLAGLENLEEIRGDFMLRQNAGLVSLADLKSLKRVGGTLSIHANSALGFEAIGRFLSQLEEVGRVEIDERWGYEM